MIAKLFDIEGGKVVPSEHCYVITWLKDIMEEYAEDEEYIKIYEYLFYMTFPNPDQNPFFHTKEIEREEVVLEAIDAKFSTEDSKIQLALANCKKMFETPTSRAYDGIAGMLDKLAFYMRNTNISDGKDGNIAGLISAAKNFEQIRASFKGAYKDLQDEQQSRVRGGKGLSYDQLEK